ncbi:MAG: hypothetical protein ACK5MO_02985, partial [Planctomyces sp.]
MRGRGVADQLVKSPNCGHIQPMNAPVIGDPNENLPAPRRGGRRGGGGAALWRWGGAGWGG